MRGVDAAARIDAPADVRIVEFDGDDDGYLDWLAVYPDGYVVNARRKRSPDYVVLHRATCGSISNRMVEPGAHTARGYVKFCAETLGDVAIAPTLCGRPRASFTKRCGFCKP